MPEQMSKQMLEQKPKQTTQPELSRPRSRPTNTPNYSVDQSVAFRNAREQPDQSTESADAFDPLDDGRWLVGIRHDRIAGTVTLLDFNPALVHVLRTRRWATLVRGIGWTIPTRYLEHTEKLLAAVDVDLFDVDGAPTPRQRDRERADDRSATRLVLAELRAAERAANADPDAVRTARADVRQAFDDAIAAARAKRAPVDAGESVAPVEVGQLSPVGGVS